ncbi:MAG: M23 family metallopeptidase [Patescibacteria group bacterium]
MDVRNVVLGVCLLVICATANAATVNTAGFQLPFQADKSWGDCVGGDGVPDIGYKKDQTHFNYGGFKDKPTSYHPGEDWNGVCGGDSDLGDPLYAVADGVVSFINPTNTGDGGISLHIVYNLPDAKQIKSIYFHLNSIAKGIVKDGTVIKGQLVATIGRTGNSTNAHLHWEMNTDITAGGAGYVRAPLAVTTALKYPSPSLFVADRTDVVTYPGNAWQWIVFQMSGNAPSSTAYVEYQGVRVSLQFAIDLGWIQGQIWQYYGVSGWGYSPVNQLFFFNTNTYALMPLLNGVTLNILRPLNTADNQADRAKADMIRVASKDPRFVSVKTETYYGPETYPGWSSGYDLHSMEFTLTNERTVTMWHAIDTQNPLARMSIFFDPDTYQWGNWYVEDLNTLY